MLSNFMSKHSLFLYQCYININPGLLSSVSVFEEQKLSLELILKILFLHLGLCVCVCICLFVWDWLMVMAWLGREVGWALN